MKNFDWLEFIAPQQNGFGPDLKQILSCSLSPGPEDSQDLRTDFTSDPSRLPSKGYAENLDPP